MKNYCVFFLPLQYQQFCSNYHGSNGIHLQEIPLHWLIMNETFFPRVKDSELIKPLCIQTIFSLTTRNHKLPLRASWPQYCTYWIFVVFQGQVRVLVVLDLAETTNTGSMQSLRPIADFALTNQQIVKLNSWLTEWFAVWITDWVGNRGNTSACVNSLKCFMTAYNHFK